MRIRMSSPAGMLSIAAAALLVAACSDQSPVAPKTTSAPSQARTSAPPTSASYIVLFKEQTIQGGAMPQATAASLTSQVSALGGRVERMFSEVGAASVSGLSDAGVAALRGRPDVEDVARDIVVQWIPPSERIQGRVGALSDQSGAFFFRRFQDELRTDRANLAWLISNQGRGAHISVLDSGIDPRHIDLSGNVDPNCSASFIPDEAALRDGNFHGTFVASEIVSNGIGMASVAPDARLCSVKVLSREGSGTFEGLTAGILYAAFTGTDVINMSLGAYVDQRDADERALLNLLQRAINAAHASGVLIVAAAGNADVNLRTDNPNLLFAPCQQANVVCVGAIAPVHQRNFFRRASYSNYGFQSNGLAVDMFAPGGDLVPGGLPADLVLGACSPSADPDCADGRTYLLVGGTSQATPQVSGAGAVLVSEGVHNPDRATSCLLRSAIRLGSGDGDPVFGHGALNVARAVRLLRSGGC